MRVCEREREREHGRLIHVTKFKSHIFAFSLVINNSPTVPQVLRIK